MYFSIFKLKGGVKREMREEICCQNNFELWEQEKLETDKDRERVKDGESKGREGRRMTGWMIRLLKELHKNAL